MVSPTPIGSEESRLVLRGTAVNYSRGGIGMIGDRLLPAGTVVHCEVHPQESQVYIPTVLRVRWSEESQVHGQYRVGLQFML